MKNDYKIANIYIDKSGTLYGAPFGKSEKYGKRPIDRLFLLMHGYNDAALCAFVNRLFDVCNSEDARDDMPPSIQTYLKAKSYGDAIRNLGLLVAFYAPDEGYAFTPACNTGERGFAMQEDKSVELPADCTQKEMASALKRAIAAVRIGADRKETD